MQRQAPRMNKFLYSARSIFLGNFFTNSRFFRYLRLEKETELDGLTSKLWYTTKRLNESKEKYWKVLVRRIPLISLNKFIKLN